jgi:hypothetical protein
MKPEPQDYDHAKQMTALSLEKFLENTDQLTHLSLPERTALIDEIARVIPAGNVPSLVAAGLASLPGRSVPASESRRYLSLLMQGMQMFLDKAAFQTFFVGPAALLSAYQMLLKLAGKDIDESFPEGTWQFYVEFGLREDSGRHTSETVGFHQAIDKEQLRLSSADELATWVTASAWLLDRYHVLLANEWNERARLRFLAAMIPDPDITGRWMKARPYGVPTGKALEFTEYRQAEFEAFCTVELHKLNPRLRKKIDDAWADKQSVALRSVEQAAYLRQMTILSRLNAGDHSDSRAPISRSQLRIGVIEGGRYYLIDIGGGVSVEHMRPICAAILRDKPETSTAALDRMLVNSRRRDQASLRKLLSETTLSELDELRMAPIILNWDLAQSGRPLAEIRSGRRGIGDHAMTVFRASKSTVFDLSHIFFDGAWGLAVTEMLTGQAIRIARQISRAPKIEDTPPIRCLMLEFPLEVQAQAKKSWLPPEVSAETTLVNVAQIQEVRRNLQMRNNKLRLTVNDILLLYRSLFAQIYQPSGDLMRQLKALADIDHTKTSLAAVMAVNALESLRQDNPALLIPIDASVVDPRERVYPTTFRNPFPNILQHHRQTLATLDALNAANFFMRPVEHRRFEESRRNYLATLYAFGEVLQRYKNVSLNGQSLSTQTIKLLAGLPASVQRMLDSLPGHFDIVNDVVKGQEVFSNVGQVAVASSLVRFNTAKDDNEKKVLAWGIMTDAAGTMHISLRDARPHVGALINNHQQVLAQQMTQEFLDVYAVSLNNFIEELARLTRARSSEATL